MASRTIRTGEMLMTKTGKSKGRMNPDMGVSQGFGDPSAGDGDWIGVETS